MTPTVPELLRRLAQLAIVAALVGVAAHAALVDSPPASRRLVAAAIGVATFAALVAVWLGVRRWLAFPSDEYGPRDDDPGKVEAHLRRVARLQPQRVERWRAQRALRTTLRRAREARTVERAEEHLATAEDLERRLFTEHRVPFGERRALERRLRADHAAAHTAKHANGVRRELERASTLKTERGRARALERARELLDRGLRDPAADASELGRLAAELPAEPPEAPSAPPPTAAAPEPAGPLAEYERDVLHAPDPARIPELVARLQALAASGFGDRTLRTRALDLARYAAVQHSTSLPARGPWSVTDRGPCPVELAVAVARRMADGQPIPCDEALAWWRATHEATPTALRKSERDFERLFRARFSRRFGEGPVAEPVRERLSATYGAEAEWTATSDLPDPAGARATLARLDELAREVAEELAPYSRALRADQPPDLRALAALPAALLDHHDEPPLEALRALLRGALADGAPGWIPVAHLLELWPGRDRVRPGRGECARYATLVGSLGYGLEPDVRFGGGAWRGEDVLACFPLASDAPHAPSRAYEAATLLVHVALAIGLAGGSTELAPAEEDALRRHLEEALSLAPAERRRLEVHLAWRLRNPPRLTGLRQRIERLDSAGRDRLADFLTAVAFADGVVTPEEVRLLERLYPLLGRDPARVHSDLHARTGRRVEVETDAAEGLRLDPALLRAKVAETRRVAALLGEIFGDEEEPAPPAPAAQPAERTCAGLDPAHTALLFALAARAQWSRRELEDLAEERGLLLDGALDVLNEAAFESVGDPLWDGEDPLDVDLAVARALIEGDGA